VRHSRSVGPSDLVSGAPWKPRPDGRGYSLPGLKVVRAPATWLALALLVMGRLVADWPLPDNHIYLLAYWCLAAGLALRAADVRAPLALSARLLVGLAFLFAVLWKAVLSPDYLDGRFFRVTLMMDDRFAGAVMLMTGLSAEQLQQNRNFLQALPEGAELLHPPLFVEPPAFRWLAGAATYGMLALEAAIAVLYLLPRRLRLEPARHVFLLTFCLVTYAFALAGCCWYWGWPSASRNSGCLDLFTSSASS